MILNITLRSLLPWGVGFGLGLSGTAVLAQTPPADPPSSATESARDGSSGAGASGRDEVAGEATITGSSARALERVPGATTVVGQRELERTQALSINEALRRVPGITVRDEEGMGLRPNISIRGLDPTRSRRVLILEDGVPVSLNPYGEPDAYYNPPIDRMQRIEVVRGSGNILYGPQTIGGVINYVTPGISRTPSWSLRALAGDRGLWGLHGMFSNTLGNTGFLVSALRRQGDGFRGMAFEVTDLYAKARLEISARESVTLRMGLYNEGSASTYVGLTAPMFEQDPSQNPAPYDFFRVHRYSASLAHEWSRPNETMRLRTVAYAYMTDRDWSRQLYDREAEPGVNYARIAGDRTIPGGAIFLRNEARTNARHYEVYGVEPRFYARYSFWNIRNELEIGARVLVEHAQIDQLFGAGENARTGDLLNDEVRDGLALAGHIQNRFYVWRTLQVTPGFRVERYAFSRLFRRVNGVEVYTRGEAVSAAAIPGISVAYGSPSLTVFGGVHRGYAPPRPTTAIDPRGVDLQLDPEYSVNYELGTRINVANWLRSELTGFVIDFRNEIVPASLAGGATSSYINGGSALHRGLEALVHAEFGRAFNTRTNVFTTLRYTLTDARFTGGPFDGNIVPYAPAHSLTATVGVEHTAGFSAQLTWLYVSRQFVDSDNTEAQGTDGLTGAIPAYNTLDFAARYTHRRTGLGATFTIKNVTNQIYIASRVPEGIFPAGFRQFLVGLRWER